MAVAIVGPAGELVYFERMDGTQLASVEISQGKARTAVLFRRPSKAFADQYAAGNTAFTTFPEKPVASEGGLPIIVNGKIIGAVGASGGTGQQDGVTAAAGASAAKEDRKLIESLAFHAAGGLGSQVRKLCASRNHASRGNVYCRNNR